MRNFLMPAIILGLLAGCMSDQPTFQASSKTLADTDGVGEAGMTRSKEAAAAGYASLPDRGELLSYDRVRRVKQSGAYTAYPVALSEEHALRAMQGGELVVNAPDGELVRLKFERHVEHPDGNWSWIGRNAEGADAVLTFGEKAVFGSIPQGAGDALRLTMNAGQSYLVTTDRTRLPGGLGVPRRRSSDVLIPPQPAAAPSSVAIRAEPTSSEATASAVSVVDVLLGYSNGLANQLGGTSQAATRLVNLVDITNQAYANSGVSMRVRLVGTMQVNYPDNTDNGDALEKLTGYKSGSGPVTPDPAFNALRAARDEKGADLVSLVRAFRSPENDGCGIAWLIGGDQSAYTTASAPFGYAVVSDGTDFDEGDSKTYFCRDETLAHELGHNMGQTHNIEISERPGVHAYSYGYREASNSGFYTVMAYRLEDSSQFSIRHFANPGINFAGRPTGVANVSDNTRSLNLTMPVAADFMATVVPVANPYVYNDVDGDGRSDVLWRNSVTGANTLWRSANSATTLSVTPVTNLDWIVAGVGDFNGDGRSDILWRNTRSGTNTIWRSANSSTQQGVAQVPNEDWKVAGVGDFDGDGKSDIVWRNFRTGQNQIWRSGNIETLLAISSVPNLDWIVAGIGDFDGDGKADVMWRNKRTGANTVWKSANSTTPQAVAPVADIAWVVAGIGDFNGDDADDVLWRHEGTGANAIWRSAKNTSPKTVSAVGSQSWTIAAVGDYDGDGKSDVLWRNISSGSNVIWKSANAATTQAVTPVANLSWFIAA